jgi:hypothetical protein
MTVGDRARQALRWLAERSPRQILFAGWIAFVLGCYPGYMSTDSALQLFTVRSGDYTDYSPVMTALWGALEYVSAGPFPMLVLQSGLFLFGLHAILRTVLSPRAAAVTAAGVLLFPPVFSVMAVIWPDPLMAGAMLGGFGAALDSRRGWKIVGGVLIAIALACRPEVIFAVIPFALVVVPKTVWWRRAAVAVGIVLGLGIGARVADWALTVNDTYLWEQQLMVADTVAILRRSKIKKVEAMEEAFAGLPLADRSTLKERVTASADALNWRPLSNGDKRIFELITTDDQAAALAADWRHAILKRPKSYVLHRWAMIRAMLGISGSAEPVYDSFGNFDLMAPLHHRATASDWERGMRIIVRGVAKTPLFRGWLYVVLAIAAIVLARRRRVLRALAISGLVYEITMFVFAPMPDFRYSHWLITATCAALAGLAVARKWAARDGDG